jgi:small basic protein
VIIGFFITAYNVRKYLKTAFLKPSLLGKILLSNILLALCLFFLRTQNIFIGVVVGCAVYIAAVTVMGVLKLSEFIELFRTYFKR